MQCMPAVGAATFNARRFSAWHLGTVRRIQLHTVGSSRQPVLHPILSCRGDEEYFKYAGGHYYKDWDTFATEWVSYMDNPKDKSTPYYYYRQVWPLAAFEAQCDRKQ